MENIDFDGIRMLIFDVDGTLAETDEYLNNKLNRFGEKWFPFIPDTWRSWIHRQAVRVSETLFHFGYRVLDLFGLDPLISRMHEKVSGEENYQYEAVEGMEETIRVLSERRRLAILTSGGVKSMDAFFRKFPLRDCFEVIISAQDCPYIKPSPCPIQEVMKRAGLKPEECLMVGDTIFDILSAHRAGVRCIAVKTGFDNEWLLKLFRADMIFDSVNDLPDRIR